MAEVKILIDGYISQDNPEGQSCSNVVLVRDGSIVMIVDPGTMRSQGLLVEALKKEGLGIEDVNLVCITHSHIDHYRNIGMFPQAKVLEYFGLWDRGAVDDFRTQFSEHIRVIKTPGHNYDAITLLVKTDKGVVAVCGDVFWKENSPEDDPYATDNEQLKESRKKVLGLADWVIPGHGKMFKTEK